MDVGIDCACRQDSALSRKNLGRSADLHAWNDAVHDSRISGLAYCGDQAVTDRNVRFVDPRIVHYQRVGYDQIWSASSARRFRGLSHTIANDLTPAKLPLIAVDGPIRFHFNDQAGIS